MAKIFNIAADCKPSIHYMVDISDRLEQIKKMIDSGQYFTMNRARQYGKTTTLRALAKYLEQDYVVVSLDFQLMSHKDFEEEGDFVKAFSEAVLRKVSGEEAMPAEIRRELQELIGDSQETALSRLFEILSRWCRISKNPIVLIIDEVDSASNNQVFLDFLSQLRGYYIDRDVTPAFQSVILAGVYDIKNIKRKIRSDEDHKNNSPWNMREGNEENEGLLSFDDCPRDHKELAPYDIAAKFRVDMSFSKKDIETAEMFGFIKNENGSAVISNRIFETVLYNLFISEEYMDSKIYDAGLREKSQFVRRGHLNMRKVLEKFVETFDYLYGDQNEGFLEEAGRRYFMLFLKPIINGIGNCYVEPETRNRERMDLVVDYRGEQFVVELKIWHGDAYNKRGEKQITEYLEYYGLRKGYMISFNFNKKKEIGVKEISVGDKVLVEAVV